MTHVGGTTAGYQKYWYDANGNATRRISGSQDVTLTYDAENRLTAMSGGVTASYVYDGDGNRVKESISGVTRVFVGNTYEVDNGAVKKYYYAGSTRVAENSGGTLYYLLTDHLGSTALTLDSSGARVTELRYYPYGAVRYNAGNQVTIYRFTGQRWDSGTALYYYGARWFDPAVGRFLAADTIVPQPGNPQSLNRYSYVLNRPLFLIDSQGHFPVPPPFMLNSIIFRAYVSDPLFGKGPDRLGLAVAQHHSSLISANATEDALPIMMAAGVAVQSQWMIQDVIESRIDAEASLGIAQMTPAEMQKYVGGGSALDPSLAMQALSRKIGEAVVACTGCSTTDKFIVAGVAQNGRMNATEVGRILKNYRPNGVVDWHRYFGDSATSIEGVKGNWLAIRSKGLGWDLFQVQLFLNDLLALQEMGWQLPSDLNIEYIQCLAAGSGSCQQ